MSLRAEERTRRPRGSPCRTPRAMDRRCPPAYLPRACLFRLTRGYGSRLASRACGGLCRLAWTRPFALLEGSCVSVGAGASSA
eukprot:scaffold4590_cov389-Prasinococcus_capsulatus_cf.AAC.1